MNNNIKNSETTADQSMLDQAPDNWRIYFLAWIDVLEKLDVLILEIRNLQFTCIYSLRCGELYRAFCEREEIMFGHDRGEYDYSDGSSRCSNMALLEEKMMDSSGRDHLKTARELALLLVSPFPGEWERKQYQKVSNLEKKRGRNWSEPDPDLEHHIDEFLTTKNWSGTEKDMLQVLRTAQSVKRQIVADRFHIYLEGLDILGLNCNNRFMAKDITRTGPRLFTLRMGILSRVRHFLDIIRDLQQRLAQNFESTPPENPRPRVHRRREQGAYTSYMSKRIQDLRYDMNHLVSYLTEGKGDHKPEPAPLVLQRWGHKPTAKNRIHLDESDTPQTGKEYAQAHFEFLQSGFWLLDQAQNFTINLHEIGHHAVRQHWKNFSNLRNKRAKQRQRPQSKEPFEALMGEIRDILKGSGLTTDIQFDTPPEAVHVSINEIAADLLAASIDGCAYAYGWMEEVLGWGMEMALVTEKGWDPHLDIATKLLDNPKTKQSRAYRDWYLRGHILITWLREIEKDKVGHHSSSALLEQSEPKTLEWRFLNGLELVLEELNQYIDSYIDGPEDRKAEGWKQTATQLCFQIKNARSIQDVIRWRKELRTDRFKEAERMFPRHTQALPSKIRNHLAEVFITARKRRYRDVEVPNLTKSNGYESAFLRLYGVKHSFVDVSRCDNQKGMKEIIEQERVTDHERTLFEFISDIPWQSAMMTAQDFFCLPATSHVSSRLSGDHKRDCFGLWHVFRQINQDNPLGRRLYALAIEMQLQLTQSPILRASNLLESLKQNEKLEVRQIPASGYGQKTINDFILKLQELVSLEHGYMKNASGDTDIGKRCKVQRSLEEKLREFLKIVESPDWDAFLVSLFFLDGDTGAGDEDAGGEDANVPGFAGAREIREYLTPNHWFHKVFNDRFQCLDFFTLNYEDTNEPDTCFHLVFRTCGANNMNNPERNRPHAISSLGMMKNQVVKREKEVANGVKYQSEGGSCNEITIPTLGKYNSFVMRLDQKPLCRCPLPKWSQYPPFFMRREVWIPVRLEKQTNKKTVMLNNFTASIPLVFLYIRLRHHLERLDFLSWLNSTIGRANLMNEDHIQVCLVDSWADIVIIFGKHFLGHGREAKELQWISKFRDQVYNHFLVARTETVTTPWSIEIASRNRAKFTLSITVFFKHQSQDKHVKLTSMFKKLQETVSTFFKDQGETEKNRCYSITDTNGPADALIFFPQFPEGKKFEDIVESFDNDNIRDYIDKIEIQIGTLWN